VRCADGRMLEVSRLLHLLAAALRSEPDVERVAMRLSAELGRPIGIGSVEYLIDHKLQPLGIFVDTAGVESPRPSGPALLGLTLHAGVVPAGVVRACTTVLRPLFVPPVVLTSLTALVAADWFLLRNHGLGRALGEVFTEPALLLLVVVLTLVGGAFHELGHATASRYGGAEPGTIGAGIYLIWPVFYNDLQDSHRLGRGGRLRCDLGGVYFNVVFILLLHAVYGLSGFTPILVVVVAQHLAMLQQFLPFVRLDGYYVVSDLAGVPDLFGRIKPVLSSLVPGRGAGKAVTELTPRARFIVTVWVLSTVPLLGGCLLLFGLRVPSLVTGTAHSYSVQAAAMVDALRAGAGATAAVSGVQLLFLTVPVVGVTVTLARALRRCGRSRVNRRLGRFVLSFGAP
jgi:putative peptide zinc metalloprotease protein